MGRTHEEFCLVDHFTSAFKRFIDLGNKAAASASYVGKATESASNVAGQRIQILSQNLSRQAAETKRLQKEYDILNQKADIKKKTLSSLQNQINRSQKQEYSYAMAIAKTREELKKAASQEKLHEAALKKKEQAARKAEEAVRRNGRASESASSLGGLLRGIRNAAVVTGGAALIKNIVAAADEQSALNARIQMMNDGLQSTADLQKQIYKSAQASRGSYVNTASMVGKFGTLAPDAFGSSAEIVRFAEQVNKHLTLSGASGAGGDAAILQLTQAMSAGVLRGEELNSILEQTPTVAQAIAKYMGVNVGKMRELASEGKITADVVKNALFATAEETNEKFEQMPMTFAQLWQSGLNAVQQMAMPFLKKFAAGATWIYDNWGTISPILMGVAAAAGVVAIAMGAQAAAAWIAKAANDGLAASLLANPLTWVALAVGVVVAALFRWVQAVGGVQTAWLIMQNWVLTSADNLQIGIMAMVYGVQDWLDSMNYKFQSTGVMVANAMGNMKVNVLTQIEGMTNGAIELLNGFINAVNKIPGVALSTIDKVSFAATAAAGEAAKQTARESGLAALKSQNEQNEMRRANKLETMRRQATRNEMERLAGIAGSRKAAESAAAVSVESSASVPSYSGNADVGKVGSVGKVKNIEGDIRLSDEDVKLYRDLAERRYMNKIELKTLAPNINVSIPESAAGTISGRDIADRLKAMLIEQMNAGTAVSHG